MESEERPFKIRKLEHSSEELVDAAMPPSSANDNTEPHDSPSVEEQAQPTNPAEVHNKAFNDTTEGENSVPKLSKNQLKKQRRYERWEAGREDRKVKRKEKIKAKKERRREEWRQNHSNRDSDAVDSPKPTRTQNIKNPHGTLVPITVIFDCDFENLMFDSELKSLGLQITRGYSDNRKAPFRVHLAVSSFGGQMKERFDGILAKQYTSWKGFQFFSEDFVDVAKKSKLKMLSPEGGDIVGALADSENSEEDETAGEIVYLSSESDITLERLKPNSTYIIGGIVDKNRHKGLCYKRAISRGIKTAKLPIGQFLQMNSRQVLATNHVLEIMLKWMEFGDWGKAFMEVIPKRKGGVLKGDQEEEQRDDGTQGSDKVADHSPEMQEQEADQATSG